jgi:hypothetical protein
MKSTVLFFLALVGVAAAFFRPAVPFQLESVATAAIRAGGEFADAKDLGLDNPGTWISKQVENLC